MSTVIKISSTQELSAFAQQFARQLLQNLTSKTQVLELVGDVGAGKTTFTRALASALGIKTPVTSPSYTLCNRYDFPSNGALIHYDFYRLDDPGIMSDDLAESLATPNAIVVVEWANSVQNLLPADRTIIEFKITGDATRELTVK